jgi:glycopeptide antibiotics resistance protein
MPLYNLLFKNKGQKCELSNVNILDHTHGAYLCVILCLVISIEGNIQKQ